MISEAGKWAQRGELGRVAVGRVDAVAGTERLRVLELVLGDVDDDVPNDRAGRIHSRLGRCGLGLGLRLGLGHDLRG